MTRYFMDSEFIDDGKTIDLISIGIVAEDGREYYAQSVEFNFYKASDWVKENVLMHLKVCPHEHKPKQLKGYALVERDFLDHPFGRSGTILRKHHYPGADCSQCPWRTKRSISAEIMAFMDIEEYGRPELWGWCAGYDFVAFCQIFGTMMDLPQGYPHYMHDLQQVLDERGISDEELPEQEEGLHNALSDARHLKKLWGYIVRNDCWQ